MSIASDRADFEHFEIGAQHLFLIVILQCCFSNSIFYDFVSLPMHSLFVQPTKATLFYIYYTTQHKKALHY